jgi:uncharacterized membrane protein
MRDKLFSGRFWLTIIAGVVFGYTSVMKILPPEAVASIITMVFVSYFERKDRNGNNLKP